MQSKTLSSTILLVLEIPCRKVLDLLKWPLLIVSIAGISSFLISIFFLTLVPHTYGSSAQSTLFATGQIQKNLVDNKVIKFNQSAVFPKQVSLGVLIRLKIPKINVDITLEHVGLTLDGAMDMPKNKNNAGLFYFGQRPGENGSTVIAGHYGWKNNKPLVFNNLYKLRQGDKLFVTDDKGAVISFVVRESRSYDPNADAADVFALNDGKSHLNLITCEGVWNKASKSYSKRLVVFADKE